MIRVAIAEHHRIVRWALREALAGDGELEVVGDAGTVEDLLAMILRVKPEVLVVDASLTERAAVDVLGELRHIEDGPMIVVLGEPSEPSYRARVFAAGAHGYVSKTDHPDLLLASIHAVSRGERIVPPEVEALLAAGEGDRASALTSREQQVMEMLARGMTNREVGEHLRISVKTVDTHRSHVLKKLRLRNNSDLTRFAVKHGYVRL